MAGVDDDTVSLEDAEIPEDAWSVAEVNAEIEAVLDESQERFPTYVVGEVADVSSYGYGTFFELRDIDQEAVISCLAWSHSREGFDHDLEEGAAGIVRAKLDYYPEQGNTQLVVSDYWPVGESARAKALAKLRQTLADEGLLAEERKQPLPAYPHSIGIVTSTSGSAREDFTAAVRERFPGVQVTLCGATVQGAAAVPSLVGAIQRLERDAAVDVIVVTRGGGSDADLWCFNEEPVVRAIADCSTPVVAAVGHEDDETLAEAVADRRAMTPTDAGVATTPNALSVRQELGHLETRIETAYDGVVTERLEAQERRVESAYDGLLQGLRERLAHRQRAADLEARIDRAYRAHVADELDEIESRIATGFRDLEADERIRAGTAEARRLRIVVAVLVALLVVGFVLVAVFLL